MADSITSTAVAKRSDESAAILARAAKIRALMSGTDGMVAKGETYLPKFPVEDNKDYAARLAGSWLFNTTKKTIRDNRDKIMEKPAKLTDSNSDEIVEIGKNIDMNGRNFSNFTSDVLYDALQAGISWVMVDAPARVGGETKADVLARNLRPYLIHITIDEMLGWQFEAINNIHTLTQIRVMESVPERDPKDAFKTVKVPQVRVVELIDGRVEITLWRKLKSSGDKWTIHGEPITTNITEIMVTPVYAEYLGIWDAEPPFDDLADVNLAHWRSQSDQTNILHHIRAPMKYIHGYSTDSLNDLKTGGGYIFHSSKDATEVDVGTVEHSADGSEAGRLDLKELELQMQALGLVLVMEKGQVTATGVNSDEKKNSTRLADVADNVKEAMERAIGWVAEMTGKPDAAGEVFIHKDFATIVNTDADSRNLTADWTLGAISHERLISEKKRRGILADDTDAQDERDKMESEGMNTNNEE